jgi:hypothetical protein
MSGRANDLIQIPASFWERPEVVTALRHRDIGRFFALVQQYTGASQTQIGIACVMPQGKVSAIIHGIQQVEKLEVFDRIADGLSLPDPARIALGLAPRRPKSTQISVVSSASGLFTLDEGDRQEDDPVRRRTFVGLTGATMVSAILDGIPRPRPPADAEALAPVLTGHTVDPAVLEVPPDVSTLTTAANAARRQYQACRYSDLIPLLSILLGHLDAACQLLDGDDQLRAFTLSADAHHVAAGLLLKLDDRGLAAMAADRSMRAALASQDPMTVGASARILTHTLMNGGHLAAAVTTASSAAQRLDHDMPAHTPNPCRSTGRSCSAARSPPPSTTSATRPISCSPRPTMPPGGSAWTATCAGPPLARSTLASIGSTSPSPSATRAPPSTWPAASTCAPSP